MDDMVLPAPAGVERCRVCGCWDYDACWDDEIGACWWVAPGVCSHCAASTVRGFEAFETALRTSRATPAQSADALQSLSMISAHVPWPPILRPGPWWRLRLWTWCLIRRWISPRSDEETGRL